MTTSNRNWLNESVDAFLAYCAFDVRWYPLNSNNLSKHDALPKAEKKTEGELAPQTEDNQAIPNKKAQTV